MGSRQHKPPATRTGRFVRGRRLDRNPLRRAADRAETLVLALLVTAFRVGAPLAVLAAGSWAHTVGLRAELAQSTSRYQVTAVVVTAPAASSVGPWGLTSATPARWIAPDGLVVTSELPVAIGTAAGTTIRLWTTRDGQLASHPLGKTQLAWATMLGDAAGAAAVAVVLALAAVLVHLSLNRRRLAAWDADWLTTGPRWTTQA